MDTTPQSWTALAEARIRQLRGVNGVRIRTEDNEIREIHITSGSNRTAKQIVRDVQTVLLTHFERSIDHRVVSVAFTRAEAQEADAAVPKTHGSVIDPEIRVAGVANGAAGRHERSHVPDRPTEANRPVPAMNAFPPQSPPADPITAVPLPAAVAIGRETDMTDDSGSAADRIRFGGVNLHVAGRRARAEVELHWMGMPRSGHAEGFGTRDGALRLIAQATLVTVQEFLDEQLALSLEGVEVTRAGRGDVVVVALELLAHRTQKSLAGCCPVGEDVQEAVVLATLSALNRIVGGLPMREPTEYVLRPTSS